MVDFHSVSMVVVEAASGMLLFEDIIYYWDLFGWMVMMRKKMKMMKKMKKKKIMSKETKISLQTNKRTITAAGSQQTMIANVYSSCVVEDVLIDFIKASVFGLS